MMNARDLPADLVAAILVLDAESVGDFTYSIRERSSVVEESSASKKSTWEHPRVIAFSNAASTISKYAKQLKEN